MSQQNFEYILNKILTRREFHVLGGAVPILVCCNYLPAQEGLDCDFPEARAQSHLVLYLQGQAHNKRSVNGC